MIFKLRDEVFARPRAGIAFNSKALEKMVTQEFGFDLTMSQVKRPKYVHCTTRRGPRRKCAPSMCTVQLGEGLAGSVPQVCALYN